jgi:hypothetical protein
LLPPCFLDQAPDAFPADAGKLNLQAEEASARVLAPDSGAGARVGRRRVVSLLLADAEHGRCLVFAHAEEGPAPDFEDGDVEPEMAGFFDLRQRRGPAPDIVRGRHASTISAREHCCLSRAQVHGDDEVARS